MDDKDILRMLKEAGATQLPGKKHEKWKLPNGKTFVRSHTASDRNAYWNQAARLRRMLGEQTYETVEGAPSKKKHTKGPSRQGWSGMKKEPFNPTIADQLRKTVEEELRQEILDLQVELGAAQIEISRHKSVIDQQKKLTVEEHKRADRWFLAFTGAAAIAGVLILDLFR